MGNYIRANFSFRRVFALLISLACFTVCALAVVGTVYLEIVPAVAILLLGLLAHEWAG